MTVIVFILYASFINADASTLLKEKSRISISKDHVYNYEGVEANRYKINGDYKNVAYCVEPDKNRPIMKTYSYPALYKDINKNGYALNVYMINKSDQDKMGKGKNNVAKTLYYSYGQPGFSKIKSEIPHKYRSGDRGYAFSHTLMAYANDVDLGVKDGKWHIRIGAEYIKNIKNTYNKIKQFNAPPVGWKYGRLAFKGSQSMVFTWGEQNGKIMLHKKTSIREITDKNKMYSLNGTNYRIYKGNLTAEACKKAKSILTIKTDKNGKTSVHKLPVGTYTILESKAPKNYKINSGPKHIVISSGKTTHANALETPKYEVPGLLLEKRNSETNKNTPMGKGTLSGAEYKVNYYDSETTKAKPKRSWLFRTDSDGKINFDKEHLLKGDPFYSDAAGKPVIPCGTLEIKEEKAPEGYLLDEKVYLKKVGNDSIVSGGKDDAKKERKAEMLKNSIISKEVPVRGDFKLVKKEKETGKRMARVVFRLTSDTTGESHIIVTDKEGEFNSASKKNLHTYRTNENDACIKDGVCDDPALSDVGIWFMKDKKGNDGTEIDNKKGALPYDTYTLSELRCKANIGKRLLDGIKVKISDDETVVDLGELSNENDTVNKKTTEDTHTYYHKDGSNVPSNDTVETGDAGGVLIYAVIALFATLILIFLLKGYLRRRVR